MPNSQRRAIQAPTPRSSRMGSDLRRPAPRPGKGSRGALADQGFSADEITTLNSVGALATG
jgi:hypothetical protein